MKKEFIYKIIFMFLFIVTIFSVKSYAANSEFTYELDANNYATITSYKGSGGEITIPSEIDGYDVKKIKEHAFNESRNSTNGKILTNVIVSEGITEIGDFAFVGCTNLKSITLPETLISLGDQTFVGCSQLNKINIPSSLKNFRTYVFQETGITEMIIHEDFETIGSCAFRICTQLKTLKVYSNDVTYADDAFEYCSSNLVLYGYEGSTTQSYAKDKGIKFEILSDESENIPEFPVIVPITSITLNKTSLSLYIGENANLIATILPENASDKTLTWYSSDNNVATVENGKITAKATGEATITVSTIDGSKKVSCNITVIRKQGNDENQENKNVVDNTNNQNTGDNINNSNQLPQTGANNIILSLLLAVFVIVFLIYIKRRNLKDI